MRELMQKCKRPRRAGVLFIYDDERRNFVSQSESAEYSNIDVGVMGAEVTHEQDEHARFFGSSAQQRKCVGHCFLCAKIFEANTKDLAHCGDQCIDTDIHTS